MNQKTKLDSTRRVRLFCMEVLNLSLEESYKVITRAQYELYLKVKKLKKKRNTERNIIKDQK